MMAKLWFSHQGGPGNKPDLYCNFEPPITMYLYRLKSLLQMQSYSREDLIKVFVLCPVWTKA